MLPEKCICVLDFIMYSVKTAHCCILPGLAFGTFKALLEYKVLNINKKKEEQEKKQEKSLRKRDKKEQNKE